MRHIVIGDIHVCLGELDELLSLLILQETESLYFIGDLIDRRPDSAGVLRRVRKLSDVYHVTLILGNHKEKFLRYLKNIEKKPRP